MDLIKKEETKKSCLGNFSSDERMAMSNMRYAQGPGLAIRYANELRSVRQTGRLPSLRSSNLHEDVLKGNLLSVSQASAQDYLSTNEAASDTMEI